MAVAEALTMVVPVVMTPQAFLLLLLLACAKVDMFNGNMVAVCVCLQI